MEAAIVITGVVIAYVAFVYLASNFFGFNDRPVKQKKNTRRLPGGTLAGSAEPCYCVQCYAASKVPPPESEDTH